MAHDGEDPVVEPDTGPTLPDGAAASDGAARTSVPAGQGIGGGYGEYPATVGALPPLGWTLPTPPEGIPVVVAPQQPAARAGGLRSEEPELRRGGAGLGVLVAALVVALLLGIGAIAWFLLA